MAETHGWAEEVTDFSPPSLRRRFGEGKLGGKCFIDQDIIGRYFNMFIVRIIALYCGIKGKIIDFVMIWTYHESRQSRSRLGLVGEVLL